MSWDQRITGHKFADGNEKIAFTLAILYSICVYGPMAMMSIGAGLVTIGFVFLACISKKNKKTAILEKAKKYPLIAPSIFLIIACVWSSLWAKYSGLQFYQQRPEINLFEDARKLWHVAFNLVFFSVLMQISFQRLKIVFRFWLLLGFLSTLLGIVQHYYPVYDPLPLPDVGLLGLYHATGMTSFHLSYVPIIGFPVSCIFVFLAFQIRKTREPLKIAALLFASIVGVFANIFSFSKIAWVTLPLTLIFILLVALKGWKKWLLVSAIFVLAAVWGSSEQVRLRFRGTDSIKERFEVWSANVEMIKKFPFFGVGWHRNSELSGAYYHAIGKHGFQSHAHNNVIDQFASSGLFGLLAFLWWNAVSILMTYKIYSSRLERHWRAAGLGLLAGWFSLHINGLTQTNFWDAKVLHQISWVSAFACVLYLKTKTRDTVVA